MAEPFKNIYNEQFFQRFRKDLNLIIKNFDAQDFTSQIMDDEWENRAYKQRTKHIAKVLQQFLSSDYKEAIAQIFELLNHLKNKLPDISKIDYKNFQLLTLE